MIIPKIVFYVIFPILATDGVLGVGVMPDFDWKVCYLVDELAEGGTQDNSFMV